MTPRERGRLRFISVLLTVVMWALATAAQVTGHLNAAMFLLGGCAFSSLTVGVVWVAHRPPTAPGSTSPKSNRASTL